MKKLLSIFILFACCSLCSLAFAGITTEEEFKQAIAEKGYEAAIEEAMIEGALSGETIAKVSIESGAANPVAIIAKLTAVGISQSDVIAAATSAGVSPAIIKAGVEKGQSETQNTQVAGNNNDQQEPTDTGLGFSDSQPSTPPVVISGLPGGSKPGTPVSRATP